jgi:integrase
MLSKQMGAVTVARLILPQLMTILRRGNSKYWYVQFQIGGKTFIKSSRSTSRKAAEQLEAQLRTQAHARLFLGHKPTTTLGDALTRFAAQKAGTPNHRNVVGHIRTITRVIPALTPLERLSSDQIEEYRQARLDTGIGPQALKHGLNVLRGALGLARRQGYLVAEVNFPAVRLSAGRLRYITPEEEARLLAELDPDRQLNGLSRHRPRSPDMTAALQDLYDLIVTLLDTGARCGEIRALEWTQVDLDTRTIRLWRPKVRNESVIFMTGRVFQILLRRKKSASPRFVFTNREGGPRNHPRNSWRKAFDRAGLQDCTIHTLRHTHATRLIQNGLSVYEVQTVLGHTDPKTTMRYAHLEQAKVTEKARNVIESLNKSAGNDAGR